ncbi:MAG: tetratricopeptide repeat protein [Candidatus Binatia bacterium]
MSAKYMISAWLLLASAPFVFAATVERPRQARGETAQLARAIEKQIAQRPGPLFQNLRLALARHAGKPAPAEAAKIQGGELGRVRELIASGDIAQADRVLQGLQARYPYSTAVWFELGMLHIRRGSFQEGINDLERAVEIDPFFAPAHHELALANAQREMPERALTHATTALLIDEPGSARAVATLKLISDLLKRM